MSGRFVGQREAQGRGPSVMLYVHTCMCVYLMSISVSMVGIEPHDCPRYCLPGRIASTCVCLLVCRAVSLPACPPLDVY